MELHIEPSAWNTIMKSTGGACSAALSTWAVDSERLRHVRIIVTETDCELSATYSTHKDDPKGLLMVAIWHDAESRYSFHT
jgi:hypothetical protein